MKKIYRSLNRTAFVFLFLMLTSFCVLAQKHVITGTVTEPSGGSFPGVNVLIKGSNSGTSTDGDGKFSIEAGESDILVFSFIGYKTQEILAGAQTSISVQMAEDVSTLQEVVVTTGYGDIKRIDLSTAQTTIKSEDISKTINTTFDQALQGRAAGVYVTQNSGSPGGGISVIIGGINTISGSNEPLYVIDGVQIQPSVVSYGSMSSTNPLSMLNPGDIDNFEILRGPQATAIYGSRGTNGVVVITTKRGKAGEAKIAYNVQYSLQEPPKHLDVLNLREYATMYKEIRTLAGGTIPEELSNPSLLGNGTDWQKALFKTKTMVKHQLSLSGGTDKSTYYLSTEYLNQDGIAAGSGFKRYSVRLNADNQLRSWVKVGANLNVYDEEYKTSAIEGSVISNALRIAPNIPVKNLDGSWGGADVLNGQPVQFTPLNPVAISNLVKNTQTKRGFIGGLFSEINLAKGLMFRTSLSGNFEASRQENFTPTYRLGLRVNDQASLGVYDGNNTYWNLNELLQYNHRFGNHDITIMASHEAQQSTWKALSGEKVGFVSNEIPDMNLGNTTGAKTNGGQGLWAMESYLSRLSYNYKEKYLFQGSVRADGSANFGSNNKWGYFPSASAAWRITEEPFMQNVPLLNELKLRFETGLTGNQGNTPYYGQLQPSATPNWGTGYYLGRYANQNLKWEQTLTNNIGFNINLLQNRIQLEGDFYIKKTSNLIMASPLPDFMAVSGPGSTNPPPVNIGSLENRGWAFTINTVNYDANGLTWRTNLNISGFKTKVTKLATENSFIDRRPWYVGDSGSGNNWDQRTAVGSAPWLFRGYLYDGLFQSVEQIAASARPADNTGTPYAPGVNSIWVGDIKYKDLNGDGVINEQDITNIGNPWPKFTFGFTNTFTWKGFELSILLTGVYGNDVYNLLRFNNTNPNNTNLGANLLKETFNYARVVDDGTNPVHLANPDATIPRISYSNVNGNRLRFTDQFVEDGSYVRIKNVQLRYNLPTTLLDKNKKVLQGAFISVSAQNLHTFTKYKGYDPEVGAYVGQNAQQGDQSIGLDNGRYPLTRIYSVSLGINF